ncbi:MAG TPA: hypothetical protein VG518_11245 [Solirubrobacterales bacterium]|nr:hypothetical protein [Solirubrobacterales bacterium]
MDLLKGKRLGVLGALLASLAIAVPLASAEEITRDEYVARVEPVCKTNTEANQRIFKGAKSEVKEGELTKASKRFKRAVVAFNKTISQIKAVPEPAADKPKLDKWIGYLKIESSYLGKIGKALGEGNKYKAQNLSVRLNRNSNLANNTVLAFGFDYCRIQPSRFSGG